MQKKIPHNNPFDIPIIKKLQGDKFATQKPQFLQYLNYVIQINGTADEFSAKYDI